MLGKLWAKCDHLKEGCFWENKWSLLPAHLEKDCLFANVKCPSPQCYKQFLRRNLPQHLEVCEYATQPCQYCKAPVAHKSKPAHNMSCLDYPLSCSCNQVVLRRNTAEHGKVCPELMIFCPVGCEFRCTTLVKRRDIPKHMEEHTTSLIAQVDSLKKQLSQSRMEASNLRTELQVYKRQYGTSLPSELNITKLPTFEYLGLPAFPVPTLVEAFTQSTILTPSLQKSLISCFKSRTECTLIYVGSRDGFSATDFHSKCDLKGPTLIVVSRKSDNLVFGGFTSVPWRSSGGPTTDPEATLFINSLQDSFVFNKITAEKQNQAVWHHPFTGPVFGSGPDLSICDSCNVREESYISAPNDDSRLLSKKTFLVKEIEVYLLKMM